MSGTVHRQATFDDNLGLCCGYNRRGWALVTHAIASSPLDAAVELHAMDMYPERKPPRKSVNRTTTIDLVRLLLPTLSAPDASLEGATLC
jgi:hypothetical protein